jgi:asparagine N-glycosylation enzyme membrane subunit Stt3
VGGSILFLLALSGMILSLIEKNQSSPLPPEAWGWAAATGVLWGLSYFFWRRLQATPASA